MEIMSRIQDHRINSLNLYVETTFGEYLSFAKEILSNNELQRKRVKTSKTVYSLLKTDLQKGCVIPPLVLAITEHNALDNDNLNNASLLQYIKDNPKNVLILDGLQRTFTLIDAATETERQGKEIYEKFLAFKLRLEVYLNINKFGVLYRMLTLNTGQTPMSARHQLEMLYSDMLGTEVDGLHLVADIAGSANPVNNEFPFKNAIEGFHSYMSRSELPIDRQELLENLKMLENMSNENVDQDLFKEFLACYAEVFKTLREVTEDHVLTREEFDECEISESPFGSSVWKVFSTSQAMTGFGAAIGRMKDRGIIASLNEIVTILPELKEKNRGIDWFEELLRKFDIIKSSSKKIGNAQRMYFQYFFRELLNKESDSYVDLNAAVENGYKKYNSQVN